jgi:hypothetical protein
MVFIGLMLFHSQVDGEPTAAAPTAELTALGRSDTVLKML